MSDPRKIVSVPFPVDEYDSIKTRAGAQPLAAYIRDVLKVGAAPARMIAEPVSSDPNPQGCPKHAPPCRLPNHGDAERRIDRELVPRLRQRIELRGESEGPHEYIARYWASQTLLPEFISDLHRALGWKHEDSD